MKTKLLPGLLKKLLVIGCLLMIIESISGQYYYNSLRVLDPRNSWWGYNGNIDTAIFVVEPKGIYSQVDMYLTFSDKDSYFSEGDTLEVQMTFNLPQGSIVNDSWLLINDKWERALILDRWTANTIYEGIVKRRRDPSILTKNGNDYYDLKVFPMAAKSTRTVKISFLVPFQYSSSIASVQLPWDILSTSSNEPYSLVFVKSGMGYKNPVLLNSKLNLKDDSSGYLSAITTNSKINYVSFDNPMDKGIYLTKYDLDKSGIYQLAFIPSEIASFDLSKNLLILVDNENEGKYSNTEILNSIKNIIKAKLNKKDSFNIFFSGLKVKKLSHTWLSAFGNATDSILNTLTNSYFTGYSDLSSLLNEGLIFCEKYPQSQILIISNSDEFDNIKSANAFIEDLKTNFEKLPSMFIYDYDSNGNYTYYGDSYFFGNAYLYGVLSRSTKGSYYRINYNETFSSGLNALTQSIGTFMPAFDVITNLENGFCYGRMVINNNLTQVYANKPILSVGKYNGSFPFEFQISGFINDSIFSKRFSIPDSLVYHADSSANTVWAGNYINEMESATNLKNEEIAKIIEFSIDNRVLSRYTAFLTLEPGMINPCENCEDKNNNPIGTEINQENSSDKIEIFGNPFHDKVRIKVSFEQVQTNALNVQIFNAMGQLVNTLKVQASSNYFEFEWDGKGQNGKEVVAGTYIIKLNAANYNKTIKVMKK